MASSSNGAISPHPPSGTTSHPEFHVGFHDFDDIHADPSDRNDHNTGLRWRLQLHQWLQRRTLGSHRCNWHNLLSPYSRSRVPTRDYYESSRTGRGDNNPTYHQHRLHHQLAVGLLTVITCCLPSKAETTAIANPVATSSGSVQNQAVQINQGGYSRQSFGAGHECHGATLVASPFYLGNDVIQQKYIRNQNFGMQFTLSVPLDGGMVEACKALARTKIQREKLNYELTRALRCAELKKSGFTFHPDSPFVVLCADIVPVNAALTKSQTSSLEPSELSLSEP